MRERFRPAHGNCRLRFLCSGFGLHYIESTISRCDDTASQELELSRDRRDVGGANRSSSQLPMV